MLLELVEYKPVFDGVFKGDKRVKICGFGEHKDKFTWGNEVIGLQRFRGPSEDDVVDYISSIVRDFCGNPTKYQEVSQGLIGLLNAMKATDFDVIEELKEGGDEAIDFLRRNTPVQKRKPNDSTSELLVLKFGYSIEKIIDKIAEQINDPLDRFDGVFKDRDLGGVQIGEDWSMHLLVYNLGLDPDLYEGVLPSREEIRKLLAHGVTSSKTMQLRYGSNSTRNFQRIYEIVVDGITNEMQLFEVIDVSETIVDNFAADDVESFRKDRKEKREREREKARIKERESLAAKLMTAFPITAMPN